MRTLRERPRMVAAQVLLALALLGGGVLLGLALSGDDSGAPDARVAQAERSAAKNAGVARFFRSQAVRSREDARAARRRADRTAAANRRLRKKLRRARKGRRRSKKKRG
jgi:hypothetical protein